MDERQGNQGRTGQAVAGPKEKAKGTHARAMLDEGIVFPDIPPPIPKLDVANPAFEED
jgi:hypothetical protein